VNGLRFNRLANVATDTHDTLAGLSVLAGNPASPQAADHGRQRSAKPARQAAGSGQFEERAAARAAVAHQ